VVAPLLIIARSATVAGRGRHVYSCPAPGTGARQTTTHRRQAMAKARKKAKKKLTTKKQPIKDMNASKARALKGGAVSRDPVRVKLS
jgi:hypothetical protein